MLKRLFPTSFNKLGLLLNLAGVLILAFRYLQLPFLPKCSLLMLIPPYLYDVGWALIIVGFFLQYIGTE